MFVWCVSTFLLECDPWGIGSWYSWWYDMIWELAVCWLDTMEGLKCVILGERLGTRFTAVLTITKTPPPQKYNLKHSILTSALYNMFHPEPSMFSVAQPDLLTSRLFHCSSTHDWKGLPMTGQNTFNHWLNSGRVVLRECQNRSKCKNNHLYTPRPPNPYPQPPKHSAPLCYLLFCWWTLHFLSILPSHDRQVRIGY